MTGKRRKKHGKFVVAFGVLLIVIFLVKHYEQKTEAYKVAEKYAVHWAEKKWLSVDSVREIGAGIQGNSGDTVVFFRFRVFGNERSDTIVVWLRKSSGRWKVYACDHR